MKQVKNLLVVFLMLVFCFISFCAAEESGTCGENVNWTLDNEGKLTISGKGAMTQFEYFYDSPWYKNSSIKSVVIENGVTNIGNYAFQECSNLERVTIPDSVTSIGDSAFFKCSSLEKVTIPSRVTNIGYRAFMACTSLTDVKFQDSAAGPELKIFTGAFQICSSLKSITIPSRVKSLPESIFSSCTSLQSVTIPSSVASIVTGAFSKCTSLQSVTIPNSVNSIGESAFSNCTSLQSVTIPNSVTRLKNTLFNRCTVLQDIYYCGSKTEWKKVAKAQDEGYEWDVGTPSDKTIHYIATDGNGTQKEPYTIQTTDNWDTLSLAIGPAMVTTGKYFKLDVSDSLSVSTMLGTQANPFKGTFDGNGRTLKFRFTNSDKEAATAPFAYIKSATIKNLHATGEIDGSSERASGLIGENAGNSLVENCCVSTKLSGTKLIGGFCIGTGGAGDKITFEGCVFNGKITGKEQCGGFVAWLGKNSDLTLTNCLCVPQSGSAINQGGTFYYNEYEGSSNSGTATLTNSYYLTALGDVQGKQAYTVTADSGVTIDWGKSTVYSVSGITAYAAGLAYDQTQTFYAGEGDQVSMTLSSHPQANQIPLYSASTGTLIPDDPKFLLTMEAKDSLISVKYIYDLSALQGSGTENSPWQIGSADDWDLVSEYIKTFGTPENRFFQMTNDISVKTMLGVSGKPFRGTFDGNGKELKVTLPNTNNNERTAPFSYVRGATIRNLHVTGSISGSVEHASGLIGENAGVSLVENCSVSTELSGTKLIGGFCIGTGGAGERITFEGCVFDGKITGNEQFGGFVAWLGKNSDLQLTNCVSASHDSSDKQKSGTFYYHDPSLASGATVTLSNCYYLSAIGDKQGEQAYNISKGPNVSIEYGTSTKKYPVSGITVYSTRLKLGDNYCAVKDDKVTLHPSCSVSENQYALYYSNETELKRGAGDAWVLTMPSKNVTIRAKIGTIEAYGTPTFTLPNGTKTIGKNAFAGIKAEVVYVPNEVQSIGAYAFGNFTNLKQIRLPKDCEIDDAAFYGCTNLMAIYTSGDGKAKNWAKNNGFGYMEVTSQSGN